jgi:hypothetical protein
MRLVSRMVVVVALALFAVSAAQAFGRAPGRVRPFLWGAWIGKQFTGQDAPWSWKAVTDFEARNAGGRHVRIVHWGVSAPWVHDFDYWARPLDLVQAGGALSLVDMSTGRAPLRDVANGTYDPALRTWASEAERWGHPILIRFDWEMNGHWYPWGTTPRNRNTAGQYVAAWRHVHDIFTAAGATNVKWVWCPNQDRYHKMTRLASLYPGSAYVDWTCLDGYNGDAPWSSFAQIFSSTYRKVVRIAPTKPMIIGEVATTGRGGSKPHWIRNMFHDLSTGFRHVHGLAWYDKYGTNPRPYANDWPIETSRKASTAFRKGIARTLARICHRLAGSAREQCLNGPTS